MILSSKQIDYFNDLKKITLYIKNLYLKLLHLEIEGKKQTKEYKKIYETLLLVHEVEEEKYSKLINSAKEATLYYQYIIDEILPSYENNAYNLDDECIIYDRILNKLQQYCNQDNENFIYSAFLDTGHFYKTEEKTLNQMKDSLSEDYAQNFLVYFQRIISNIENQDVLSALLHEKYAFIFQKSLPSIMFKQDSMDVINRVTNRYDVFYHGKEDELEEAIKFEYYYKIFSDLIRAINLPDEIPQDVYYLAFAIFKTCLVNLSSSSYMSIYQSYQNDQIKNGVKKLINTVFKEVIDDRVTAINYQKKK